MFDTSIEVSGFHKEKVTLSSEERSNMRDRRNANRSRLKNNLKDANKPNPIGLHTQGSYAMHTMVQEASNDYDIDDGVYFKKEDLVGERGAEMSALAVRQMVCEALQSDKFKTSPEVLKNCVRVYYNEGFHVDVPSYRQIEKRDFWTGKTVASYELASSDWKISDSKAVTKWFKDQNKSLSSDIEVSEGQFCRVVRLLKAFARSRDSWKSQIASGFMITILVAERFVSSPGRDDISLRETMRAIKDRLEIDLLVEHPTLKGEKVSRDEDPRPGYLKDRLIENLKHLEALDDKNCKHGDAMSAWDRVYATDWFSSQTPPKSDSGSSGGSRNNSAPSRPVEKRGDNRFA